MSTNATLAGSPIPSHVPEELVWDRDLNAFAAELEDPFIAAARLHDGPDIVWCTNVARDESGWLPTRYDVIQKVFMDAVNFSSTENIRAGQMLGVDWRLNPLEIDPPDHRGYRMVLQKWFAPAAIAELGEMVRGIAIELISKFENNGGCEFMDDFATPFPSYIFLELMGMPRAMLPKFLEWEHAFVRGMDMQTRLAGARAIKDYMEQYLESRRSDERSDLVSGILNAKIDGRPLNHGEIMGMCMVLYFGGLDTVASSLGWYFKHLATDVKLQERLRNNPADIPKTIEELLRAYGVTATRRTVVNDLEFNGIAMKKGDTVYLPTFLASRDPRQYKDPHVIDPDRNGRYLTLAAGTHLVDDNYLGRITTTMLAD